MSNICGPLTLALNDAVQERNERQADLQTAPPNKKPGIVREIRRLESEISRIQAALANCANAPPPIQVAGVEQSQAIQYFDFNSQGTRAQTDNSIELVSGKPTVLRVYPRYSDTADWLGISEITGRVSFLGFDDRVVHLEPMNPGGTIVRRPHTLIDRGRADHTLNFRVSRERVLREPTIHSRTLRFGA